jgi:hypothetical protein
MSKVKGKSKELLAREAKEVASVARFTKTSAKVSSKPEAKVEIISGVQVRRLEFIRANTETIRKAWSELKGKKSANSLERTLPLEWKSEWVEEVLHLNGLRASAYKTIQAAAAEDKSLLDVGKKE